MDKQEQLERMKERGERGDDEEEEGKEGKEGKEGDGKEPLNYANQVRKTSVMDVMRRLLQTKNIMVSCSTRSERRRIPARAPAPSARPACG